MVKIKNGHRNTKYARYMRKWLKKPKKRGEKRDAALAYIPVSRKKMVEFYKWSKVKEKTNY